MRKRLLLIFAILAFLVPIQPASAVNPDEVLADPELEARARSLSTGIRCLVCQNRSIDDSDAELARDLRILVREKLTEGLTDEQILDFLVDRYGEFVLLKPRLNAGTYLLWATPFALLLIAGGTIIIISRSRKQVETETTELTEQEKSEIAKILDKQD